MKRRRYRSNNFLLVFMACLLSLLLISALCFYKMRPVIIRYAVSVAETKFLDSANEAVLEVLADENVSYNDMLFQNVPEI